MASPFKPTFVLLICLLFLGSCTSSKKDDSDWAKFRLKGKVKSFSEKSYVVTPSAKGIIVKGKRERAPSDFDQDKTVSFNLKGMETDEKVFLPNDNLLFSILFSYNEAGQLKEIERQSPEKVLDMRNVFEYDSNGNRVKQISYNDKDAISYYLIYHYDDQGNNIKKEWFQGREKPDFIWDYFYDEHHNLIESKWLEPDGTAKRRQIYKYDKRNRLVFQTAETTGQSFVFKRSYVYKKGLLTEESWNDGSDDAEHSYHYFYDDKGSQIRRIEYVDSTPIYMVDRQINYFES